MDDTGSKNTKVPIHERSKNVADLVKSHYELLKIVFVVVGGAGVLIAYMVGHVSIEQARAYLPPGLFEFWGGKPIGTALAPEHADAFTAAPVRAPGSDGTRKAGARLSADTKATVAIYATLGAGSDESSRALLEEFRQELGRSGYRLASDPARAALVCELSGTVQSLSDVPGAIVSANLTARWTDTSDDLVTLTTGGNGVGSTPETAAARAYRNAANELFGQFDGFVKKGATR